MKPPLAELLRPQSLSEVIGQDHLLKDGGLIFHIIEKNKPQSLLLYGPPGCGKTTIAKLYAKAFNGRFTALNAPSTSVAEVKKVIDTHAPLMGPNILFIDEIHRFNKAQQDLFLPYIEKGDLILIGATTENPSFALNKALLSRMQVAILNHLTTTDLEKLLQRYESLQGPLSMDEQGRRFLIEMAAGDGRYLLGMIESLGFGVQKNYTLSHLQQILHKRAPLFDREGEEFYNLISALHKSIRASDANAALYYLARMLQAGADPHYLLRRLIRVASEDIGLADPGALPIMMAASQTYERLGSPEGELAIASAVLYLALSPKSNAVYTAWKQALASAEKTGHLSPPLYALNAPTDWMKEVGYSQGYHYDHDTPQGCSGMTYFPTQMEDEKFYHPVDRGFEREMIKRMTYFEKLQDQFKLQN